jgi:hypothetical protein
VTSFAVVLGTGWRNAVLFDIDARGGERGDGRAEECEFALISLALV